MVLDKKASTINKEYSDTAVPKDQSPKSTKQPEKDQIGGGAS